MRPNSFQEMLRPSITTTGISVSPSRSLSILARTMPGSLICSPCLPSDEPSEQFEQIPFLIPDDFEAKALELVFVELDRIDRDAGSEQVGAELENMLAAMGVAHGQRFEIDVLEVDQSTAAGSLEVEAAAAQQA